MVDFKADVMCFCGSSARLRSNALLYNGREYGNGMAWICGRYPDCTGSVGTHPDGSPLGTLVDKATKQARQRVHALIDPLWRDVDNGLPKKTNRRRVYRWLRHLMAMTPEECHVGSFTLEQCEDALKRISERPYQEADR